MGNSLKKKKLVIESSDDEQDSKENIPNSKAADLQKSANVDTKQEQNGVDAVADDDDELPETNLDLPTPYRKTARKGFKRKSDVEQLQENKIKKLKTEQEDASQSELDKEAETPKRDDENEAKSAEKPIKDQKENDGEKTKTPKNS